MYSPIINRSVLKQILSFQKEEVTVGEIYTRIASTIDDSQNRDTLRGIAGEELEHYGFWKKYTARDVLPDWLHVLVSSLLFRVLGYTFTLKFLASRHAREVSKEVINAIPDAETILMKDEAHKKQIIALTDQLDEERFHYVGAIVLGMNDALVEFIGILAGLTLALQQSKLIIITGIVAGISASLSMAASEYLSQRSEEGRDKRLNPPKAAVYTGITYFITVALLLLPFVIIDSPYIALPFTLATAFIVIFVFTFYISVAKGLNFWRRFAEMTLISMGIAVLSFVIGLVVRLVLHVSV
jgi:VIT1/CCC1 family predicted Fe2+/Mn2+ transporter